MAAFCCGLRLEVGILSVTHNYIRMVLEKLTYDHVTSLASWKGNKV
jgi:hypothetical protein